MKKLNFIILISLIGITFFSATVTAGVTEIKVYTNENGFRLWDDVRVGPNHAATALWGDEQDLSYILGDVSMNDDIDNSTTPTDTCSLWATEAAAAVGPYGLRFHFVNMPNPRLTFWVWLEDYLDASATERITFWIKGEEGNQYPLWLRVRSQNHPVDTKDVEGAYVTIDGETIIRTDPFGFHFAAADVPFNGEWQFVSIPWSFLKLATQSEVEDVIPYSWAGTKGEGHHVGGPDFDLSTLRSIQLDTKEGGQFTSYPWPDGGNPVGRADYLIDELVLTLNEGSGVNAIDGTETVMPLTYSLADNFPNPFNPTTNITYAIPASNHVTIKIYNSLGQTVKTLVDQYMSAGTYQITWDGTNLNGVTVPSGVYFYQMQSSHFNVTKKMLLMK